MNDYHTYIHIMCDDYANLYAYLLAFEQAQETGVVLENF